jgi:hypothetical protein
MDTPCQWYRSVPRLPDPPPTRHRRGQSHSKLLVHSLHRTLPAHHRDAGQQSSGRRQGRQARSADPSRVGRQAPRLRVVAPAVLRHRNRRALRRALPPLLLAPACPPQPAGFVGAPCSLTLRARGDDVLGLDNFNAYYDPALKRVHQRLLAARGVAVLDAALLERVFASVPFTHVLHLAAQAGVRHAMRASQAYVRPMWPASSPSSRQRRGMPTRSRRWSGPSHPSCTGSTPTRPFSEDHPASLYATTKKAGEASIPGRMNTRFR